MVKKQTPAEIWPDFELLDYVASGGIIPDYETVTAAHIEAALIPPILSWGAIYDVDDFCELDYQRPVWCLDGEVVTI